MASLNEKIIKDDPKEAFDKRNISVAEIQKYLKDASPFIERYNSKDIALSEKSGMSE
jgi:hypothetical protein